MSYLIALSNCLYVQGLSEASNYHEFCRLLARLKSNYQLSELVQVTQYTSVIKAIAEFTVTSLRVSVIAFYVFVVHASVYTVRTYMCM